MKSSNHSRRRPTIATGLCLVGLALGASMSSALPRSEQPAHRSLQEDDGGGAEATTVTTEQIEQIKQIMVDFTLGDDRGHLKDPDLLDGDNPGWTNPPTKRPTLPPTPGPTLAPTPEPSPAPTEYPTMNPTKQPTPSPTMSPTLAPTPEPSPAPTEYPTEYPTMIPTKEPTLSPTMSPTQYPTANLTTNPTSRPTIDPCEISGENFSYFPSDASSSEFNTPMAIEVPFVYEVQTDVEFTLGQINALILPKVEQALGDELLPVLFDECVMGSGGGGATGTKNDQNTAGDNANGAGQSNPLVDGSIVGIATSPPDVAVPDADAACTVTETRPDNNCAVVEGILTVYVPVDSALASFGDDSEERQALIDEIVIATQDAIRDTMESSALNDGVVDESVETVTYSRDGPYQEPIVALGTGEGETTDSGNGIGPPIYIAIAVGAVAVGVALLIVGAKMRSRQNEDKGDYESDEDEEGENDENDVSGFHDNPTEIADRDGKRTYDMEPVSGEDWAAVRTTAAVLASASDAAGDVEEAGAASDVEEAVPGEEEEQQQ